MLESLEQSNIKRMSVEEPETQAGKLFDAARDISAEDWKRIDQLFKNMGSPRQVIATGSSIKRIDPNHKLDLTEDKLFQTVQSVGRDLRGGALLEFISRVRLIDPSFPILANEQDLSEARKELNQHKENGAWWSYIRTASALKRLGKEVTIDDQTWDELRTVLASEGTFYTLNDFMSLASRMKILRPEFRIDLDAKKIQRIEENLEDLKRDPVDYLYFAANLSDLNYELKPKLDSHIASVPEQRNF